MDGGGEKSLLRSNLHVIKFIILKYAIQLYISCIRKTAYLLLLFNSRIFSSTQYKPQTQ